MTYEVSWKDHKNNFILEVYGDLEAAIDRTTDLQLMGKVHYLVFVPDLTKVKKSYMEEWLDESNKKLICDFTIRN